MAHALSTVKSIMKQPEQLLDVDGKVQFVLFNADEDELEGRIRQLPRGVIVEPEILHRVELLLPADWPLSHPLHTGGGWTYTFVVRGAGQPISDAEVYLRCTSAAHDRSYSGLTNSLGECTFSLGNEVPDRVVVSPKSDFWAVVGPAPSARGFVDCPPLSMAGPCNWVHECLGVTSYDDQRGAGIRVGVIDTGVGPHPNLRHVTLAGGFYNSNLTTAKASAIDRHGHGTHVAGIIGARPQSTGTVGGVAPGCQIYAMSVGPTGVANQAEIEMALRHLIATHQVDLVNISLGAMQPSQTLQDAVADARESGALCICAAGNSNGPVHFPAAFPEAVAVSAIGKRGTAPSGTLAASREPQGNQLSRFGRNNLFLANFSSHGIGLDCAGPGVGVISTVPSSFGGGYRDMCGTSMASPAVCGALAVALSQDTAYRSLPRDASRADAARKVLGALLRDAGLPPTFQGGGVPLI